VLRTQERLKIDSTARAKPAIESTYIIAQINKYNGSYRTVKLRSANELYKELKGYDILMTAKELGKMMDYIGGGGSMFPAEELENAVDDFLNEHGSKDDMTAYRDMESRLFAIAETERQNAFALGFETAVSLILSRELI